MEDHRHIVIESPDGRERQFVRERIRDGADATLDGYEGWTVLGETPRAPAEDEEWADDATGLRVNPTRRRDRAQGKECDPRRLLDRIERLEARLADIEAAGEVAANPGKARP